MSMSTADLCGIQECLMGYRKYIEWVPTTSVMEQELKANRIDTINHLMNICSMELTRLSEVYRSEE